MTRAQFCPPAGWPPPPPNWSPPSGWRPDPSWPRAPEGWQFWQPVAGSEQVVRGRGYQLWWLVAYWGATTTSLLFLASAATAPDIPASSYAALGFGTVASVVGSAVATALFRARVAPVDFDDATSATRVLTVAWGVLVAAMLLGVVVGSGFGERPSAGPEAISAVLSVADGVAAQIFGVAALFVVVGESYTRYRRLTVVR